MHRKLEERFRTMQIVMAILCVFLRTTHTMPISFISASPWPHGSLYRSEGSCEYELSRSYAAGLWLINVTTNLPTSSLTNWKFTTTGTYLNTYMLSSKYAEGPGTVEIVLQIQHETPVILSGYCDSNIDPPVTSQIEETTTSLTDVVSTYDSITTIMSEIDVSTVTSVTKTISTSTDAETLLYTSTTGRWTLLSAISGVTDVINALPTSDYVSIITSAIEVSSATSGTEIVSTATSGIEMNSTNTDAETLSYASTTESVTLQPTISGATDVANVISTSDNVSIITAAIEVSTATTGTEIISSSTDTGTLLYASPIGSAALQSTISGVTDVVNYLSTSNYVSIITSAIEVSSATSGAEINSTNTDAETLLYASTTGSVKLLPTISGVTDTVNNNNTTDSMCCCNIPHVNITDEELLVKLASLTNDLKINKKETKLAKSKKISAKDNRPSVKAIGTIGVLLMCSFFGVIIISDLDEIICSLKLIYQLFTKRMKHKLGNRHIHVDHNRVDM